MPRKVKDRLVTDSRLLFGVGLLLVALETAYSADRPYAGCYQEKTLFRWPGQAPSEEEEEEQPLATDRPDFTEASSTVGRGRAQLEFGYTYSCDDEDGVRVRAHSFPETLLRVGMIAEWFEFRIQWNYGIERTTDAGLTSTISGPEDLYLGVKLWLTEQDGWFPEMALVPQMTVPTAPEFADLSPLLFPPTRAFGAGEVLPGVNWLYGWDVGEIGYIAGSTQVNRALDESGLYYEEFAQSITVGYSWTEKLTQYTEWFAFFPHGAIIATPEHYLNGGYTYLVNNNFQLDARVGCGLNDAATDFFAGAGAAYRY
jgi:hypothetical protein